jgi:hypothetical protein
MIIATKTLTQINHDTEVVAFTTLKFAAIMMTDNKNAAYATSEGRQGNVIAKNKGKRRMIKDKSGGIERQISPGKQPQMKAKLVDAH